MKQIFESGRISFTEVSEELINDYLIMVNDMENVNRYLGKRHEPYTEDDEIRWVRKKLEEKALVFSMLEKKTGSFIGNIELMDVDETSRELGIALTADKQNRGYGTEAILAVIEYGFSQLKLETILLRTDPENLRAIHVYEKCGFQEYDRNADDIFMKIERESFRNS